MEYFQLRTAFASLLCPIFSRSVALVLKSKSSRRLWPKMAANPNSFNKEKNELFSNKKILSIMAGDQQLRFLCLGFPDGFGTEMGHIGNASDLMRKHGGLALPPTSSLILLTQYNRLQNY